MVQINRMRHQLPWFMMINIFSMIFMSSRHKALVFNQIARAIQIMRVTRAVAYLTVIVQLKAPKTDLHK